MPIDTTAEKKKSLTLTDLLVILSLCSNYFCHGTVYAVLAPFLPAEVRSLHTY